MGFSKGTEIFDAVVEPLLKKKKVDIKETIEKLIVALENNGWDEPEQSIYFTHPLVKECFLEIDPDYCEIYDELGT